MTKDDLLFALCQWTAYISGYYDPKIYSIRGISKTLGESQYRIRKLLKELESDGSVSKNHEGGADSDGYPYCCHGWSITEKVYDSELYKKCYAEALEEYEEFEQKSIEEYRKKES